MSADAEVRWVRDRTGDLVAVHDDPAPAHPADCTDGWLGGFDADHPRPCLTCRPHLARKENRR